MWNWNSDDWNHHGRGGPPYRRQLHSLLDRTNPCMPEYQPRDSRPGARSSRSSETNLASLPAELIIAIAGHLDFAAFMNLRLVNLRLSAVLLEHQSTIIRDIWYRELGDIYNEAVSTMRSHELTHQDHITTPILKRWLEDFFTNEPDPINTINESHMMNNLNRAVEYLMDEILDNLRGDQSFARDLARDPLTTTERYRFRRSLYRLEILSRLFGTSMYEGHRVPEEILVDVVNIVEAIFTDGELAEMYSVGWVLEQRLNTAMWPYHRVRDLRFMEPGAYSQYILAQGMIRTYRVLLAPPSSQERHAAIFGNSHQMNQTVCFITGIFNLAIRGQVGANPPLLVDDAYGGVAIVPVLHRDPHTEAAWRNVSQSANHLSKLRNCASLFDQDRWERLDEHF